MKVWLLFQDDFFLKQKILEFLVKKLRAKGLRKKKLGVPLRTLRSNDHDLALLPSQAYFLNLNSLIPMGSF